MKDVRTVGIVLFEGVEVIDFAGPLEVFGITGEDDPLPQPFSVFTVAERSPVVAKDLVRNNFPISQPAQFSLRSTQPCNRTQPESNTSCNASTNP